MFKKKHQRQNHYLAELFPSAFFVQRAKSWSERSHTRFRLIIFPFCYKLSSMITVVEELIRDQFTSRSGHQSPHSCLIHFYLQWPWIFLQLYFISCHLMMTKSSFNVHHLFITYAFPSVRTHPDPLAPNFKNLVPINQLLLWSLRIACISEFSPHSCSPISHDVLESYWNKQLLVVYDFSGGTQGPL